MIEFEDVEPDGDGVDEELSQGREHRRPGSPRTRRMLGVVAIVLVGGGIVTYAQLSGSAGHRTAARPSPSTAESLPSVPPSGTSAPGGLLVEHLGDRDGTKLNDVEVSVPAQLVAPGCPDGSCAVGVVVPAPLTAAVRRVFPAAARGSATTATLRPEQTSVTPRLWSRVYRAQVDGGSLTILVARNDTDADTDVEPTVIVFGTTTVAYVRHIAGRYRVEVQLRTPTAHAPPMRGLSTLAADPRLIAS